MMGISHTCISVYLLIANVITVAYESKLKAMENLFRGEIYLLRDEVTAVANNQESIMKILNDTADKVNMLAGPGLSNINDKINMNNNENHRDALTNLSEEVIRTRRGFYEEKVARKNERETILSALENKIANLMASKMDKVIEKVKTSNEMLQTLNGKVNEMEQRLDNLELLHRNEINERLDSMKTVIEEKVFSGISSIQTDVKLFKTIARSVLGRLFSKNHYPTSGIQECLDPGAKNFHNTHENAEKCLAQNYQALANLILPQIRLAGGHRFSQGRVELLYNGTYGTICDNNWDDNDSKVVCKMLGYTRGESILTDLKKKQYGAGTGTILLDQVKCTGEELSLFDCQHKGIGNHYCSHDEDVAVECS